MLLAALGALLAWFFTFLQWQIGLASSGRDTFLTGASSPVLLIVFVVALPLCMIGVIVWWAVRGK
jgi:hypothetical protein